MLFDDNPCTQNIIQSECELIYAENKLQALIAKQIDMQYGTIDIMTMLAVIVALGAMVVSLGTIVNNEENKITLLLATSAAYTILATSLLYGIAGWKKQKKDPKIIQEQIKQLLAAIIAYKPKPEGN